jgi:putative membrane protein insertion efficiency factor
MSEFRRMLWILGTPARLVLIGLIHVYRLTLSGWLGGQCRFYPTCSHYAEDAVRLHGAVRGFAMTVWRIARCGPFTRGGVDPAPPPRRQHGKYDTVTRAAMRPSS